MLPLFPVFISLQNNKLLPYYVLQVTSSFVQYHHALKDLNKFDEFQFVAIIMMLSRLKLSCLGQWEPLWVGFCVLLTAC